jgi:hypothetical protein
VTSLARILRTRPSSTKSSSLYWPFEKPSSERWGKLGTAEAMVLLQCNRRLLDDSPVNCRLLGSAVPTNYLNLQLEPSPRVHQDHACWVPNRSLGTAKGPHSFSIVLFLHDNLFFPYARTHPHYPILSTRCLDFLHQRASLQTKMNHSTVQGLSMPRPTSPARAETSPHGPNHPGSLM